MEWHRKVRTLAHVHTIPDRQTDRQTDAPWWSLRMPSVVGWRPPGAAVWHGWRASPSPCLLMLLIPPPLGTPRLGTCVCVQWQQGYWGVYMISGCIMCTLLAYPKKWLESRHILVECMGNVCACEASGVCTCEASGVCTCEVSGVCTCEASGVYAREVSGVWNISNIVSALLPYMVLSGTSVFKTDYSCGNTTLKLNPTTLIVVNCFHGYRHIHSCSSQ